MPIGPNRSGFSELMMQYTYLPRLCGWPGRSAGTRSMSARLERPLIGFPAAAETLARRAWLPLARDRLAFFRPAAATGRAVLDFGFGMFPSARAARGRVDGRAVIQHFSNLHRQIFRQTGLGDEPVASSSFRVLRDTGECVAGHGEHWNVLGPLVGFEAARGFPPVHDG